MSDEGHELFPAASEDQDPPAVETINVTRHAGPGRKVEWAPRAFGADELQSLEQLYEWFGGGDYELIARAGGRISARRQYTLGGKSRRLGDPFAEVEDEGPTFPQPSPQPQIQQAAPGAMNWEFVIALLKMQSESSNATVAALAQMMAARGQDSDRMLALVQEQSRESRETMANFFQTMLQSSQGQQRASVDSMLALFREGMQLGRDSMGVEDEGGDDEEAVTRAMEGATGFLQTLQSMRPGQQPPHSAPPRVAQPQTGQPTSSPVAPRQRPPSQSNGAHPPGHEPATEEPGGNGPRVSG